MSLTIVHVVFSSRIAGGEHHCIDLARAQAQLGHDVHIVGPARTAIRSAVGSDVRYHAMTTPFRRAARLKRIARELQADVCHGHLGPACKAVAKVEDSARIATLHVGYKPHQHSSMDGLICVNSVQRERLGGYAGLSCVIHNWPPESEPASPADLRKELGISPEQLVVGSVGRLNQAKGMDLLIKAFKYSAPTDAVLVILGQGEEMTQLKRLAAGDARIRLLGFRRDVNAALRAMDLFVSASREEAFPLAVLEAMRAGRPIISTSTDGPSEMLAGQPAELVPVDDMLALSAAMARRLGILRSTPRYLRQPVAYDLAPYDRAVAVRKVIDFYHEVLRHRQLGSDAVPSGK